LTLRIAQTVTSLWPFVNRPMRNKTCNIDLLEDLDFEERFRVCRPCYRHRLTRTSTSCQLVLRRRKQELLGNLNKLLTFPNRVDIETARDKRGIEGIGRSEPRLRSLKAVKESLRRKPQGEIVTWHLAKENLALVCNQYDTEDAIMNQSLVYDPKPRSTIWP
jgi:hypothetical protein